MALGAVAIALSSATEREHSSWQDAAQREGLRYGVEGEYVRAGMEGREMQSRETEGREILGRKGAGEPFRARPSGRTLLDWLLVVLTTGIFAVLAVMAKFPHIDIAWSWAVALTIAMLALLATCGIALWRTTRFR